MGKEFKIKESLLDDIISEIEGYTYQIEHEFGHCRDIQKLIDNNEMPDCYYKLIEIRDK